MKFDNVQTIVAEARTIELPLGQAMVTFDVAHCDVRSVDYLRIKQKIGKPLRKLIEIDALPADKDRAIAVRAFVQYCVRGWGKITSDGVAVPYSEDNAVELLTQAPDLFYALISEAQENSNFAPSEEDAKN